MLYNAKTERFCFALIRRIEKNLSSQCAEDFINLQCSLPKMLIVLEVSRAQRDRRAALFNCFSAMMTIT